MIHCRRCHGPVAVVRESTVERNGRRYSLTWRRCRACDEVMLSYHQASAFPRVADATSLASRAPREHAATHR